MEKESESVLNYSSFVLLLLLLFNEKFISMQGNEWIYLGALLDGNGLNLLNRLCNCSKHRVKIKKPECSNGMECSIKNCSSETNSISVSSAGVSVWFSALVVLYWFASWRKSIWTNVLYGHTVVFPFHLRWCEVFFAFGFEWTSIVLLLLFFAVIAWILFHFLVNVGNMHVIDDALCSFCRHSVWPNRKQCITAEKSVGITNMQIQMSFVYTGFCMQKPHFFSHPCYIWFAFDFV